MRVVKDRPTGRTRFRLEPARLFRRERVVLEIETDRTVLKPVPDASGGYLDVPFSERAWRSAGAQDALGSGCYALTPIPA